MDILGCSAYDYIAASDLSTYVDPEDINPDYSITSDKINVNGELMPVIDLLNIGIQGDIKVDRDNTDIIGYSYNNIFVGERHTHINVIIGKWNMHIYSKRGWSQKYMIRGYTYDIVNMKQTGNEVKFTFIKDNFTNDDVICSIIFREADLRVTLRLDEPNSVIHTCWL
jgi:hypothetical protein